MSALPTPIPHAEAQQRLLAMAMPLGEERRPVADAAGRYLARDLPARRTQPPADLSAMDGYALGEGDLAGPWRVIGESAAGHPFAGRLAAGEAVRISTGAMLPPGAGAILLQENAARDGERLTLNGEGEPTPRHIRRAGMDFREGERLLRAGERIGAAQIALALAGGHGSLPLGRRPRLAILDNGDELGADPEDLAPHQIPASNGAMLAAMAAPHAEQCDRIGPVPDRLDAMLAALERAGEADVIVTSGGASVGDHDLVRPALEEWGATLDFWRIAMKPGKPLMVARRGRQIVLGLPGNPVSSYVTAFLFLLPLLRRLAGAADPLPPGLDLPLGDTFPATGARAEFVRARLADGALVPLGQQDSGALGGLAAARWLVERPANAAPAMIGDVARAYSLDCGAIA